jgi:hypothetical protein
MSPGMSPGRVSDERTEDVGLEAPGDVRGFGSDTNSFVNVHDADTGSRVRMQSCDSSTDNAFVNNTSSSFSEWFLGFDGQRLL